MFDCIEKPLPGIKVLKPPHFEDDRGDFTKLFHYSSISTGCAMPFEIRECYISSSQKGVVRGMHFQTPPHQHSKIVTCLKGEALDVVVDLRSGSPTYGIAKGIHLNALDPSLVVIPIGFAHGFAALTDDVRMIYFVSSEHAAQDDHGILWSSIDFNWPFESGIISPRDAAFPMLEDFDSPFVWNKD